MMRLIVVATIVAFSAPAFAHIQLSIPTARTTAQKTGPCGEADSERGLAIATFEPGETITVTWNETVNHPGHYRISFDPDGQDDFEDPAAFDDFNTNEFVLVDNIADKDGGAYSQDVTLPMEPCDNCTLQVVQVMTDKAPYGDGNDLYYQCADIEIVAPGGEDMGGEPDAGTTNNTANNTTGNNTTGNNTVGNNSTGGNIDVDDDLIDGGDGDDSACSTAGGAAVWPILVVGLFGWVRRRRD